MEMNIMETDGRYTHVTLSGKMDIGGVMQIDLPLTGCVAAQQRPAIIDMTDVSFVASLGIRALLSNAKALQRNACALVLVNPQEDVRNTLIMAGLDKIMPIYDTVEAAIEAVLAQMP